MAIRHSSRTPPTPEPSTTRRSTTAGIAGTRGGTTAGMTDKGSGMTTRNRFRRLAATVAVSALPLAGASALITAQPAAAQLLPVNPFGTTGFAPRSINFHPDNSTTEVNNFGNNNTTLLDNGGAGWD